MATRANDVDQHKTIPQRKKGRRTRAGDAAAEEDPKYGGRADLLRECVESEGRDDRASLAARGGDTVRERAKAGWEDLCGVAVRRRICAEVEEELQERETHDERNLRECVEAARKNAHCNALSA